MILRFVPSVSEAARRAVIEDLEAREVEFRDYGEFLVLARDLGPGDSIALGSLEGVDRLAPADARLHTVREVFLRWTAANCLVLGILVLLASNLPSGLGPPADPLRTPEGLRPAWPMLAWHELDDRAPPWLPVPLLVLAGSLLLLVWPFLAGRLAERRPAIHAALGAVLLLAGAALAVLGWMR